MEEQIPRISVYDEYSISSDDSIEIEPDLPSKIAEHIPDTSSDTSSDDYTEMNIMYNNRRKPSFVKKSLKQFSTRIDVLPEKLKETLIIETNSPKGLCCIIL